MRGRLVGVAVVLISLLSLAARTAGASPGDAAVVQVSGGVQGLSGGPLLDGGGHVWGIHGYLVGPWILPDPSGAGAVITDDLRRYVATIPIGTRVIVRLALRNY